MLTLIIGKLKYQYEFHTKEFSEQLSRKIVKERKGHYKMMKGSIFQGLKKIKYACT